MHILESIIDSALNSQVNEIKDFGKTLMILREEIINSFYIITTVDKSVKVISKLNYRIAKNKNKILELIKIIPRVIEA